MSILLRNDLFLRKIFSYGDVGTVAAGEPTYTQYFNLPAGFVIDKLEACTGAGTDGTDNLTALLRTSTTTLYTVTTAAADTPVEDTGVATGQEQIWPDGTTLNVSTTFNGTSENITGGWYVVVWGHIKPRG